jgi:hypothetical protein
MSDSSGENDGDSDSSFEEVLQQSSQGSGTARELGAVLATPVELNYDTRTVALGTPKMVTSFVWDHFGKYPDHIRNKANIVVCTICRNSGAPASKYEINYGISKSSSKLSSHLQAAHKKVFLASKAEAERKKRRASEGEAEFMGVFKSSCKMTRRDQVREAYLKWIVDDYLPLDLCYSPAFRYYMKCIDKNFECEDRKGVRTRVITNNNNNNNN